MKKDLTICPYCGNKAKLVDSSVIYGRSFGKMWLCEPCQAWVGAHKNSNKNKPLGRLANKELREWKIKVHDVFDPLWKERQIKYGTTKKEARNLGYRWLSEQMGIPQSDCHIGHFDITQCQKAYEICLAFKNGERV